MCRVVKTEDQGEPSRFLYLSHIWDYNNQQLQNWRACSNLFSKAEGWTIQCLLCVWILVAESAASKMIELLPNLESHQFRAKIFGDEDGGGDGKAREGVWVLPWWQSKSIAAVGAIRIAKSEDCEEIYYVSAILQEKVWKEKWEHCYDIISYLCQVYVERDRGREESG